MRKTKEILRMRLGESRSLREVSMSVQVSPSVVHDCVVRFKASGLSWPLDEGIDDAALEERLYRVKPAQGGRPEPDYQQVHKDLRHKGVTLYLLWQEYKQAHLEDGYQYSAFCHQYRRWQKPLEAVMRQEHKAGEKAFVDWSGNGIKIRNLATGEEWEAPLFVGVLGASGYAFCKAAASREMRHWIQMHIEMYEHFEGVPAVTVPDNEKTGVTSPCRYEPDLNRTYMALAGHYGTVVIPARPGKPRDKAMVENAVLNAQRWILAALRNHVFFTLAQANTAIAEKLQEYNGRAYQKLGVTRREQFEEIDRPVLRPLPAQRYEFDEWSKPTVNIDYHVVVDDHYYSVPYALIGQRLEARRTASMVELMHKGRRVASHTRSYVKGKATTLAEHMPRSHREHQEWTPSRLLAWAGKTGPQTRQLCELIMQGKPHPELGYRACLGVMRLAKKYGVDRLEEACGRAVALGAANYKTVNTILVCGADLLPAAPSAAANRPMPPHENIRGADYYQ